MLPPRSAPIWCSRSAATASGANTADASARAAMAARLIAATELAGPTASETRLVSPRLRRTPRESREPPRQTSPETSPPTSPSFAEGPLDEFAELAVALRTADVIPARRAHRRDDERRRPADAVVVAGLLVDLDLARVRASVESRLPLVEIEVEFLGVPVEVLSLDLLLVGEHLV